MEYTWLATELTILTNGASILVGANYTVSTVSGSLTASMVGYQSIPESVSSSTPIGSLTNDLVVGWIQEQLGPDQVLEIEIDLENQIRIQRGLEPIENPVIPVRPVENTEINNEVNNQTPPWMS